MHRILFLSLLCACTTADDTADDGVATDSAIEDTSSADNTADSPEGTWVSQDLYIGDSGVEYVESASEWFDDESAYMRLEIRPTLGGTMYIGTSEWEETYPMKVEIRDNGQVHLDSGLLDMLCTLSADAMDCFDSGERDWSDDGSDSVVASSYLVRQ